MYTQSRHSKTYRGRAFTSPWGERIMVHTTYLVSEAMALSPRVSNRPAAVVSQTSSLGPPRCIQYASRHNENLPWARTVAQPMGRDNGSHTHLPSRSEAMYFSPRISRTDCSAMSSDLTPRPPTMYTPRHEKLTVGAHCGSPMGREIMAPYCPTQ
jgi:hypothetical protein